MATMTAKKKAPESGGKIRSVTITPAENGGAVVTCDRERPKSDRKNAYMDWEPPKPAAFGSLDEAIKYAADELGVEIGEVDEDEK